MDRKEFLLLGATALSSGVALGISRRLLSPSPDPMSKRIEDKDREWYEKHKRAAKDQE